MPCESESTLSPKCWLQTEQQDSGLFVSRAKNAICIGVDWAWWTSTTSAPSRHSSAPCREADAAIPPKAFICAEAYHPSGTPLVAFRWLLSVCHCIFYSTPLDLFSEQELDAQHHDDSRIHGCSTTRPPYHNLRPPFRPGRLTCASWCPRREHPPQTPSCSSRGTEGWMICSWGCCQTGTCVVDVCQWPVLTRGQRGNTYGHRVARDTAGETRLVAG